MTLYEYKLKIAEVDRKVTAMLSDDKAEGTVYVLYVYDRKSDLVVHCVGVFRRFENLRFEMEGIKAMLESTDEDGYDVRDYSWFAVDKYLLDNGEYSKIMSCKLDYDENVLMYNLSDGHTVVEEPLIRDVEKPFCTGDILLINSLPFSEPQYAVYIYDESMVENINHHIALYYNGEYYFGFINSFQLAQKVDTCPVGELNTVSKKIKGNGGDHTAVFDEMNLEIDFLPF